MTTKSCTKVWLFYLKVSQGLRGRLSLNVTREVCSYLADPELVQVTETFLRFFHCHTATWGPERVLSSPILADESSSWAVLKDGSVFCSGGGGDTSQTGWRSEVLNEAYLLGRDGSVETLPSMIDVRKKHGVIEVLNVYVFGGCKL